MNEWIKKYLNLGWSLIPLKPKGKEPLIPWKEFQTRKASEQEIKEWFQKWPNMNLGTVSGKVSGIVIVDLDGIQGLKYGNTQHFVSSVVSRTGNGKQLFYKWKEHVDNSASKIAPGVDIRGDGGFVVLPPSVHPNGRQYRWERFVPEKLQDFPTGIMNVKNAVTLDGIPQGKPEGWIAKALEEMHVGNIDNTLVAILGRLRRDGYSSGDALALLQPSAIQAGAIEGHLEEKIRNIWNRYEPKTQLRSSMSSLPSETLRDMGQSQLSIHVPSNDDSFRKFEEFKAKKENAEGLKTGFPTLDRMCEGDLKSERLFTLAALTGVGKTNFGIALSANLCKTGKRVLYFSTEYQYQRVWNRYIATLNEPAKFREHAFYVVDSFRPNIEQVEACIKEIKPDVFIFDYIQHIGKEKEVLTAFMQGCQYLQRHYNTQGVILAQLNRRADVIEEGKKVEPQLSMIEGSATIEQASSRVLLLTESRVTDTMNEIQGYLAKNDEGDKGLIHFGLMKNPYKFVEINND